MAVCGHAAEPAQLFLAPLFVMVIVTVITGTLTSLLQHAPVSMLQLLCMYEDQADGYVILTLTNILEKTHMPGSTPMNYSLADTVGG